MWGNLTRGNFTSTMRRLYLPQETTLTPRMLFPPVFACRRGMEHGGSSFRWMGTVYLYLGGKGAHIVHTWAWVKCSKSRGDPETLAEDGVCSDEE